MQTIRQSFSTLGNSGRLATPGDMFVFRSWGVLLGASRQRSGMLLNTLQCSVPAPPPPQELLSPRCQQCQAWEILPHGLMTSVQFTPLWLIEILDVTNNLSPKGSSPLSFTTLDSAGILTYYEPSLVSARSLEDPIPLNDPSIEKPPFPSPSKSPYDSLQPSPCSSFMETCNSQINWLINYAITNLMPRLEALWGQGYMYLMHIVSSPKFVQWFGLNKT